MRGCDSLREKKQSALCSSAVRLTASVQRAWDQGDLPEYRVSGHIGRTHAEYALGGDVSETYRNKETWRGHGTPLAVGILCEICVQAAVRQRGGTLTERMTEHSQDQTRRSSHIPAERVRARSNFHFDVSTRANFIWERGWQLEELRQ